VILNRFYLLICFFIFFAKFECGFSGEINNHDVGANVINFESFGFSGDLRLIGKILKYNTYESFASKRLNRTVAFDIANLDAAEDPKKIFLTASSQGCANLFYGTYNLIPEQRKRLIITAVGSVIMLPRELGFLVTNQILERDSFHNGAKK
jgi:hypothetical protein